MTRNILEEMQKGIESHLERFPDVVVIGEPRIKNLIPFNLYGMFNLIKSAEYLIAPKGNGIYNIGELNEFLKGLVPNDDYINETLPAETICNIHEFRKIKPRKNSYVTIGKIVFSGKRYNEPMKVDLLEGELVAPPGGKPAIVGEGGSEFNADSVGLMGLIIVYPHEEIARRSYEQAEMKIPIDEILIKDLRETKRRHDPNLIQRIFA